MTGCRKILIFVHCFFPEHIYGTETYTLQLAKHLREYGYEPTIVTALFPGGPLREESVSYYEYEGLPVYLVDKGHFPPARVRDTYYQDSMREVYRQIIRKVQPDMAHVVHLSNHTGTLAEVLEEEGIPSIATLTDFFGFCMKSTLRAFDGGLCEGPAPDGKNCELCYTYAIKESEIRNRQKKGERILWERGLLRWPSLWRYRDLIPGHKPITPEEAEDIRVRRDTLAGCYHRFRAVIVPTEFTRSMYEKNGLTVPIYQIPFGVDGDIQQHKKPDRMGQALRFGYIGQIDHHKGVDVLVEAFRQVGSPAELYIYGQERHNPHYFHSLVRKSANYAVQFPGLFPPEEMTRVLDELDFVVIPSRWYENCPLILISALASHTPVIVSDVPGLTEFIEQGKSGYSFPLGDVAALAEILKELAAEPEKARLLTNTTFFPQTWEEMAKRTIAVYQQHMT